MDLAGDLTFFVKSFAALLAVMDPLGAIPIFLAVTAGNTRQQNHRIVHTTTIGAAVTLVVFALAGMSILQFFGITIDAFKASGGILILLMALSMMNAQPRRSKHTPEDAEEGATRESPAIVPLAIPLLVGPGTMSTIVLLSERAATFEQHAVLYAAMAAVIAVTWISLRLAEPTRMLLGETGIRVATRIMGLILAALAVQFIADGMLGLFPGLGA